MTIDRAALAEFLRQRREALQPEDVGLPRGSRRRTGGLRREEAAALCHMSTDYLTRLEQRRGPHPSEQMTASIAQGLHLSLDERDHLFRLAGHRPPERGEAGDHIGPGLMRILDRLQDTPAEVVTELGETLRQTPPGIALTGDLTAFTGARRSVGYRWFTDPSVRERYHPGDHEHLSRLWVSGLREVVARRGPSSRAAELVEQLRPRSEEFARLWERHEVGVRPHEVKRFVHPEVGPLALHCQTLMDPTTGQSLLVYTAEGADRSRLELLRVVGSAAMR